MVAIFDFVSFVEKTATAANAVHESWEVFFGLSPNPALLAKAARTAMIEQLKASYKQLFEAGRYLLPHTEHCVKEDLNGQGNYCIGPACKSVLFGCWHFYHQCEEHDWNEEAPEKRLLERRRFLNDFDPFQYLVKLLFESTQPFHHWELLTGLNCGLHQLEQSFVVGRLALRRNIKDVDETFDHFVKFEVGQCLYDGLNQDLATPTLLCEHKALVLAWIFVHVNYKVIELCVCFIYVSIKSRIS